MKAEFEYNVTLRDEPGGCINIHPDMRGGVPVVKGTRVPLARILAELAEGRSLREITDDMSMSFEITATAIKELADELSKLSEEKDK